MKRTTACKNAKTQDKKKKKKASLTLSDLWPLKTVLSPSVMNLN